MATLVIEGSEENGAYRVRCSCLQTWKGRAEPLVFGTYSPALPVAEAAVHWRLEHAAAGLYVEFSPGFRMWLERYWEATSRDLRAVPLRHPS